MTNEKERVAIFLDWHNIERTFRELGGQPDILVLRDYLTAGRHLLEAFVYAGIHSNRVEEHSRFHAFLRREGFLVRTKLGKVGEDDRVHCNFDVEIVVDMLDFSREAKPDTVVLGSGDGDFAAVVERLRLMGIRVEVASITDTVSEELREISNGFIDLKKAVSEATEEETEEKGGE